MISSTQVTQNKLDYGFLVLTHIVCADQQITSEKLQYLREVGDLRNISEQTKSAMQRILAQNQQHLKVDYIANETINEQRSLVMQQILATFYDNGLFNLSEQEAIMGIAKVCNWSQKGIKRMIQAQGFKFQSNHSGSDYKKSKTSVLISSEIEKNLVEELQNLPENSKEDKVNTDFISRSFFDALGFDSSERANQFNTGKGSVDYALRHNTKDDSFLPNKVNPYILVELKSRNIDLAYNKAGYRKTVNQLKGYLLGSNCKSVKWGIITNSKHIQLFRKHGKAIYPATSCLEINPENIVDITSKIRKKIENPSRALTVAVYNNKGGVGKTTTVINLAAALTRKNQKVLVIDFDPNQKDLTNSLDIKLGKQSLYECLKDKKDTISLKEVISPYTKNFQGGISLSFDVIPVDDTLHQFPEDDLRKEFSFYSFRKKLYSLKSDYDYILIDAPPNWRFFSINAVYASDVVLIPTKHNNIRSLQNAAVTIQQYLPEIQKVRQEKTRGIEWGASALPIFFNGEKIADAARVNAKNAINRIIKQYYKKYKFDLIPYFYPHYKPGNNTNIFELPNSAHIAYAAFEKIPAAYKNKIVCSYYTELAKEYFLQ
ncbi:MAG: AAA family ATPase [Xenococcus sp. (in: cyanobacteria)]